MGIVFLPPRAGWHKGAKKQLRIESSFANAQLLEVKGDKGVKEDKDDSQSP